MQKLSKRKVNQALKDSVKDGSAYSAMDGITSTYTTPFALALGANNAEIGLLSSIPNFFATILQPFVGRFIERRSRKAMTTKLALLQRLIWIPVVLIPFVFFEEKIWLFMIFITLSHVVLSFTNTAWSSWIGSIVPEKIRGIYFGKRNTIQSAFSFFTTLLAGWLLGLTNSLFGFSVIFFLAFVFGLVSYFYLTRMPEIGYKKTSHEGHKRNLSIFEFLKDFKKYRNFYPFTIHMSLINFAVNIASPFFTVYMLKVLRIGYEWYAIVVAAEILTRIVMQTYWGKLSDRFGDRTILIICNILIALYPFFWLFVTSSFQIIFISIFAGISWSGFDLSVFNYLLDVTPPEKRPVYISKYKMLTGFALFLGALIGGYLAQYFSNATFLWLTGLQIIFLISFILRGLFTVYGASKIEEVRIKASEVLPVKDVFLRAFAIYPARGITNELVYAHNCFECWEKDIKKGLRARYTRYLKVKK